MQCDGDDELCRITRAKVEVEPRRLGFVELERAYYYEDQIHSELEGHDQ